VSAAETPGAESDSRYKWLTLSNTTLGQFMASLDGSIVIIAMPAIFRGIHLDPLSAGNIGYLLWMVLGYLLVTAVAVVSLGRLGDIYGRVRMYNLGFLIFTVASLALSLDPYSGRAGALWIISIRVIQALGGAMLNANSSAILTDAFPADERGMALGVNGMSALVGQFVGLVAGGALAAVDWRAVFWINVPIGIVATLWSYRSLRETSPVVRTRIDWAGNLSFAVGTGLLLIAITHGIQPYGGHATGWTSPVVLAGLGLGVGLLLVFVVIEGRVAAPMLNLGLFHIRAFAAGMVASLLVAIGRGGLQFMLIIWLQGIWLPSHGYPFSDTPLWAGIYILPMTGGFLVSGPVFGRLSDRYGARVIGTLGAALISASFAGLLFLPVDFDYVPFALLLFANGTGQGMFAAPNAASVMSSVPAGDRGAASGVRATFQNSGAALSIGIFFSLMTTGLSRSLPGTMSAGLQAHGVPSGTAQALAHLPPVSSLFAAFLGDSPIRHLLASTGTLGRLSPADVSTLTGSRFFPDLIAAPFHQGLVIVFGAACGMSLVAALASAARGARQEPQAEQIVQTTYAEEL
jgi:MFS family permease